MPLHSVQALRSALRSALPALECVVLDWRHGVGRLTPDDAHPGGFSWRISPIQFSIDKQETGESPPAMRVSDKAGADKTSGDNPHIHTQSAARTSVRRYT